MPVDRTYHVLGVPLRTGSLYPGSENDAQAYRDAGLLPRLHAASCRAVDDGDLAIPSYLPHHSIPPIRSWPGPRIVWDALSERVGAYLGQPGPFPVLIGCDCSVVVGTTQALLRALPAADVHVLYIDGDFDDAPLDPARCQSAAACAVWLLTHRSPFWVGPPLAPSQVTVIGATTPARSERPVRSVSLADVRGLGAREAAQRALAAVPAAGAVLVHLDVDAIQQRELPAAYFPHAEGLTLSETTELLDVLVADSRTRLIEVSEYASLRDADHRAAGALVDVLARALSGRGR